MTDATNYRYYMAGTTTWFLHFGLQMVLFTWLVAIELDESADRVGLAQMAMMLPSLLLMLIGGMSADRYGGRPVVIIAHLVAGVAPLALALVVVMGGLSYPILIAYALWIGACQAFITPARDGMLAQIAGDDIQRAVTMATGLQFATQIIGFSLAAATGVLGPAVMMVIQGTAILFGAWCYGRVRTAPGPADSGKASGARMIADGLRHVLASATLRASMYLTFAIGVFFMGVFMVGIPLLLRDLHGATPADLALAYVCNMIGTTTTVVWLLRRGGVVRRGRAYIASLFFGGLTVGLMGLAMPFWSVVFVTFLWGAGGGIAMSMGRTIAQEAATPEFRGRVMSIYALTLFGGAPFGAAAMGYLVEYMGVLNAMFVPAAGMVVVTLLVGARTSLWRWRPGAG